MRNLSSLKSSKKLYCCFAVLVLIEMIFSGYLMCQSQIDTLYYDKDWNVIQSKVFADYYRVILSDDNIDYKKYKDFYSTGELQGEGQFLSLGEKNDNTTVFIGVNNTYYKNGKVASVKNYVNGLPHGEFISYDENGLVTTKANMENGTFHGLYTKFMENGYFLQVKYDHGIPTTPYYVIGDENGNLIKVNIDNDQPYWETPDNSTCKTIYKDGISWQYYMANGLTVAITTDESNKYGKWLVTRIIISNHSSLSYLMHQMLRVLLLQSMER